MNKIILISTSLMLVSLILAGSATAVTYLTGCNNNLDQLNEVYNLQNDVVVPAIGTCFTIKNDGITLNGNNHKIGYSKYEKGYGVRVNNGLNNINIINLDMEQMNSSISDSHGIYASYMANSQITGNTIKTIDFYGHGIYLAGGNTISMTGNTITTERGSTYGIYLASSNNHQITGNTITTTGFNSNGVHFISSRDSILRNNIFNTASSYAIYVSPTTSATYYRHDIDTSNREGGKPIYYYEPTYNPAPDPIDGLNNIGQLYLANSPGITISNIVGISDGITVARSPGVNIINNNFDVGSQYGVSGIFLHPGTDNAIIEDNTIRTDGSLGYGVHLRYVQNSRLRNNIINADDAYAIYVQPTGISSYYNHDIDTSNTEQGKEIHYYYQRAADLISPADIPSDIAQLYVADSNGIRIGNINGIKDGITLAMTDNSVVSGSTINTASQAYVKGIYLHSSSNGNNITGNTIISQGYRAEGIYVDSCPSNTIEDNTITTSNTEGYGIYMRYSGDSSLSDNIISSSGAYAYSIHINSSDNVDVTGNSINAFGTSASGIHLEGSSDSYIADNNINAAGNTIHGIFLETSSFNAEISGNTVATSNTGSNGIYVSASGSGNISGNNVTTSNSNSHGIYVYSSGSSIIGYNDVKTDGSESHGIYLSSSDTNTVTSNTVTTTSGAGSGSSAAYLRDSSSNALQDNAFDGQGANNIGLYLSDSYNNNLTGGFILGASHDLSIGNAGSTNNFTDIGFSVGGTVQFRDTVSLFNYRTDTSTDMWLRTGSSPASSLERTIFEWNDMLINWTETTTPSAVTMDYEVKGLVPDTAYSIFKTSAGVQTYVGTYTSDAAGTISFSLSFDGIISIEINGDTDPPIVTVINYPDPVLSDATEIFEVTCDDGSGTGCDKTTISTSHYTCTVDHMAIPPETSCVMDLIAECEAKTYIYNVDSVDLAHNHNTSVNGTFDVKKADGCSCISSDECLINSCLAYTICAESESPGFYVILTNMENEFENQFDIPLGEEKTILMNIYNPLGVPDTIEIEFEGSPPSIENWLDITVPDSSYSPQYSSMTKKVSIKPHSKISIPITVFAGKVGAYSLTINAQSTTTGQRTFNTTRFSIISTGDDSLSTQSPGLAHASFILLLFISVLFLEKKDIS